jgi:carbonic anhydrase/acetyltransferase-like protein (isoleucine patch superfamily)
LIYALGDREVTIHGENWYIADSAAVIGSVTIHNNVSIWFNAVVRADNEPISIGEDSNVQDGSVLHVDVGFPLSIGRGVTVGHKVMLHGCRIGDNTLIGMNAVILNGAVIGKNCIVGAHALVAEGKQIPDGSLVLGSPGRVMRSLSDAEIEQLREPADDYIAEMALYRRELRLQESF